MKKQIDLWTGKFGKDFTDRNSLIQSDRDYLKKYGITKLELDNKIIGNLPIDMKILEVGCGTGNQLVRLEALGFRNLYGIDISSYAVDLSRKKFRDLNIIQGNAFDIPFKDNFFDMVFTSGLLIHIHPFEVEKVMDEIYRCSKKYIWGLEYYSDNSEHAYYRDEHAVMWKNDYSYLYLDRFEDLRLIEENLIKYKDNENVDTMFLLEKI